MADDPDTEPRHPIRVVARRTGLSPAVLRAWERRYQAVRPSRSEGGQRLYSDLDVRRLALIAQALEAGRSIRHVAALDREELQRLVEEDARSRPPTPERPAREPRSATSASILQASLEAVEGLDSARLDKQLMRATVLLTPTALVDDVLLPLLTRIGVLWEHGSVGPATEHAASVTVRRFLDRVREAIEIEAEAPILVCATPAGHRHEFGALIAAVIAAQCGWRSAYLGPDLPADEIASATRQLHADAIALSAVWPVEDSELSAQVSRLTGQVDPGTRVFIGGPAAHRFQADLTDDGAIVLERLGDLRDHLESRPTPEDDDPPDPS